MCTHTHTEQFFTRKVLIPIKFVARDFDITIVVVIISIILSSFEAIDLNHKNDRVSSILLLCGMWKLTWIFCSV